MQPEYVSIHSRAGRACSRLLSAVLLLVALPVLAGQQSPQPGAELERLAREGGLPPEELGRRIAQAAWDRDRGFGDFSARITLYLRRPDGRVVTRKLRTWTLETPSGDKSISVFDAPADVKRFARLTWAHEDGQDDQWLYIPKHNRVKRLSHANDASPFMGTEYANEDLGSQRPEEVGSFTYRFLRLDRCGPQEQARDLTCFVVERRPVNPYSGYSKQVVWIDTRAFRLWRVDYYDRKGKLLKTQWFNRYQQFRDRYWRPMDMLMVNHRTGNSTRVIWSDYRFGNGFSERDFTPENLLHVR
ncbi:MAG: outer membrane lipoprotein-sorting protein [Gammaproteobacteria bacterium]|nr:MAG: outer membrane lipoprotein-sorting protein [Gammaproteobacteria bacterium]